MPMTKKNNPDFIFFGTDEFAVFALDELKKNSCMPRLLVTNPDQRQGRRLVITPPPVKSWALKEKIPFIQPENLKAEYLESKYPELIHAPGQIFLVASYGKILPSYLIDLPPRGTLNIHPSLLPKYRGPAPITSAILAGDKISGVTIMLVDAQMDHGPILAQKQVNLENKNSGQLEKELAEIGARLWLEILPNWLKGDLVAREQNHDQATLTKKINKTDGLINLDDDPQVNYRKFLALSPKPGIYFFKRTKNQDIRLKITAAHLSEDGFVIDLVIPAGKNEMKWVDFKRNL